MSNTFSQVASVVLRTSGAITVAFLYLVFMIDYDVQKLAVLTFMGVMAGAAFLGDIAFTLARMEGTKR